MKHITFIAFLLFCCLQVNAQVVDYLKEANTCFEQGDYPCAKRNYTLFQTLDGRDMSTEIQKMDECIRILTLAGDFFGEGEYEKARDQYKALLAINVRDPHAKKQYDACEELLAPVVTIPEPVQQPVAYRTVATPSPQIISSYVSDSDYKKFMFGVDLGVGSRNLTNGQSGVYQLGIFPEAGVRGTLNFSPYFGWDVASLKIQGVAGNAGNESLIQAMTGVRVYTSASMENIRGYASLKAGYGRFFKLEDGGLAYELEIGMSFSKTVAAGIVYNGQILQGTFSEESGNFNSAYFGLRVGLSF